MAKTRDSSRMRGSVGGKGRVPTGRNDTRRKSGTPPYTPPQKPMLYMLDTNVLMTKPTAIYDFEEHDVEVPFRVLRELDDHMHSKNDGKAAMARRAVNELVLLAESIDIGRIRDGIPLAGKNGSRGKLYFEVPKDGDAVLDPVNVGDHEIILHAKRKQEEVKMKALGALVTDDKLMRLIARVVGVRAEEFRRMSVSEETEYATGVHRMPDKFWSKQSDVQPDIVDGVEHFTLNSPALKDVRVNEFLEIPKGGDHVMRLRVVEEISPHRVVARRAHNYRNTRVYGINAIDAEQSYALDLLMDPKIPVVIIEGPAGSGKNLITLAAGLQQLSDGVYDGIIATRDPVAVSRELGFKPGTEKEKLMPWMRGMTDNLAFLTKKDGTQGGRKQQSAGKKRHSVKELLDEHNGAPLVELLELSSMRGSSLHGKWCILDENQNSTPEQIKLFLTRIPHGGKAVILGNFNQNDRGRNDRGRGFARLIEITRGWPLAGHIVLPNVHRGPVAKFIEEHY